ncbi:MAG: type II toxin-antitoxin system RelE/ParE family toxin [Bacteroidota bacterium]
MELKIFWTDFAKIELKSIYEYYKENAHQKIAKEIAKGISNATLILKKHQSIGQIEELLTEMNPPIRYMIYTNYKILYRILLDKNTIEILDVFDTRQNPKKMIRSAN